MYIYTNNRSTVTQHLFLIFLVRICQRFTSHTLLFGVMVSLVARGNRCTGWSSSIPTTQWWVMCSQEVALIGTSSWPKNLTTEIVIQESPAALICTIPL